jgi:hypothetical protein
MDVSSAWFVTKEEAENCATKTAQNWIDNCETRCSETLLG